LTHKERQEQQEDNWHILAEDSCQIAEMKRKVENNTAERSSKDLKEIVATRRQEKK